MHTFVDDVAGRCESQTASVIVLRVVTRCMQLYNSFNNEFHVYTHLPFQFYMNICPETFEESTYETTAFDVRHIC